MTLTSSRLAVHGGDPIRTTPIGQWPEFGAEEEAAVLAALRSGIWGSIDGTFVKQLEVEFANLQAARHGVATVNATMGLAVAMKAVGIEPGDEVIVPPYTFIATASAALMIGAIPVFADVDPESLLIDPARIEAAVGPRTKAIVPVHHGGSPVDMDGVMDVARRRYAELGAASKIRLRVAPNLRHAAFDPGEIVALYGWFDRWLKK